MEPVRREHSRVHLRKNSSRRKDAIWIVGPLYPVHQLDIGAGEAPDVDAILDDRRGTLDRHFTANGFNSVAQPSSNCDAVMDGIRPPETVDRSATGVGDYCRWLRTRRIERCVNCPQHITWHYRRTQNQGGGVRGRVPEVADMPADRLMLPPLKHARLLRTGPLRQQCQFAGGAVDRDARTSNLHGKQPRSRVNECLHAVDAT